jgi:hypothetical protein
MPLAGGGATFLADLDSNYDAAFQDATHPRERRDVRLRLRQ